MWNKNVETFIGCGDEFEEARIVIFGAPFDSTTSFRPGARFASRAMRGDSWGLETYSPYQDKDLMDLKIFDGGDLELRFGNPKGALEDIKEYVAELLDAGKIPCMIGGEHLVTLGSVEAVHERYPDLRVLQFDAHTDLREDYLGEKLSHATVMRRIWDLTGDGRIYQFGIRSGEKTEFAWAEEHTFLHKFSLEGVEKAVQECKGHPVYLTIDLDVLDPSVFPGTGTPEAGGIDFLKLLDGILRVSELNIVGMDVNELSPAYDASGASTAVACKVLRELLLAVGK
jgi:agmatinase